LKRFQSPLKGESEERKEQRVGGRGKTLWRSKGVVATCGGDQKVFHHHMWVMTKKFLFHNCMVTKFGCHPTTTTKFGHHQMMIMNFNRP